MSNPHIGSSLESFLRGLADEVYDDLLQIRNIQPGSDVEIAAIACALKTAYDDGKAIADAENAKLREALKAISSRHQRWEVYCVTDCPGCLATRTLRDIEEAVK